MASSTQKKLLLINPGGSYLLINLLERIVAGPTLPYALFTLAALTPKEYDTKIINQKLWWRPRDFTPGALVGITCLTSSVCEAYRLADKFRSAGSRVVLGGPHVSALPEEALQHADSVVIGEAESVWGQVLDDFEHGRLQQTYVPAALEDFFTPVYDYFLGMDPRALGRLGVHIDRGCKYHCDFCARISNWLRPVKIEQVLGLVKRICAGKRRFSLQKPAVMFRCDNIYSNPSYAKALFKALIPLKINWTANSSIDISFDEEALQLAEASGCRLLLIGFESQYPKDFKKTSLAPFQTIEDYRKAIGRIKAHGVKVIGSFIVGLDSYTHRDYWKLLWFLMRSGLFHLVLTILTPFPGSPLFDRLKKENRILTFDWKKYNFYGCVIKPKNLSVLGIYAWFWLIRIPICFFMPFVYIIFFYCFVLLTLMHLLYHASGHLYHTAWDFGYDFSRDLFLRH
jgi:radical SAM superfamily enzyme YgiQ (UPF0313 family)